MRVSEIERIDIQENQDLNQDNIKTFIEYPLIEPIEMLVEKGIKTRMSSCNKYNANWINYDGTNVFTKDLRKDLKYKDIYSYGYGYAYIMLDFDSLSENNKRIMEELYIDSNKDIEEEALQTEAYCGKKRVIYGAVPMVRIVGNHELDSNGFLIRPGIYFSIETIKRDSLNTNDAFFLENYNVIPTSTQTSRIVIVRYPVNQDTETSEVTDYFKGVAEKLANQREILQKK